jgi:hypothetical protein
MVKIYNPEYLDIRSIISVAIFFLIFGLFLFRPEPGDQDQVDPRLCTISNQGPKTA